MKELPDIIAGHLLRVTLEQRFGAYFCVDSQNRLLRAGGETRRYGMDNLEPGADICQSACFLVGMLPLDSGLIVMPRLEVAPSIFADVHVIAAGIETWILLLDSSEEVAERAQIEQALRQAEEHLRQAERMEAVGRLAGGIAHDFNNLLTAIVGYGDLILGEIDERDPIHGPLLEMQKAGERATVLVRQLLAFSRHQVAQTSVLDLNEVITDAMGMLKRIVGEDVRFALKLEPRLEPIKADRGQLQQVILNLVVNARDAMPRGGLLTIATSNIRLEDAVAALRECVALRVEDTGTGMDEETRARIFEPFFTTKEKGIGTGLGLSTVHGIVIQSGGEIEVRSSPGKGTEFEIRLPTATGQAMSAQQGKTERVASSGGETILLVEDDELVRRLVHELLTRMNYHVLEADSAAQALSVSADHSGPIHLILTDVVMPRVSGTDLVRQLRTGRPDIKTLLMSGYSSELVQQRGQADLKAPLLQKPFTRERLSMAVREALDAEPRTRVSGHH